MLATYQRPQDGSWDAPPGVPIPRGIEVLRLLHANQYRIVIHSSRKEYEIQRWVFDHGLSALVSDVTSDKVPAHVYLDDRAVRFDPRMTLADLWGRLCEEPWWSCEPDAQDRIVGKG